MLRDQGLQHLVASRLMWNVIGLRLNSKTPLSDPEILQKIPSHIAYLGVGKLTGFRKQVAVAYGWKIGDIMKLTAGFVAMNAERAVGMVMIGYPVIAASEIIDHYLDVRLQGGYDGLLGQK